MSLSEMINQTNSQDIVLHDGLSYVDALTQSIAEKSHGDRIAVATMSLEPTEEPVNQLLNAMEQAAQRGAEVSLLVDGYAFLVDSESHQFGPLFVPFTTSIFTHRRKTLACLAKAGAHVTVTNKPSRYASNPFAGRSHIKGAVINDTAYIGGPNLHNVDRVDAALEIPNAELADFVFASLKRLEKTGDARTAVQEGQTYFADGSSLLLDSGERQKSYIQSFARRLIASAQEDDWLLFTTQFVPRGQILQDLAAAHERGVDVQAIFTPPSGKNAVMSASERFAFHRLRKTLPKGLVKKLILPSNKPVHAKVIATPRNVLVGSHNFDPRGIQFGTAEIAYACSSTELGQKLGEHILRQCS